MIMALVIVQVTGIIRQQLFERSLHGMSSRRGCELFYLRRCLNYSDKPDQGMDFAGFLQLMQWWKPQQVAAMQLYCQCSERC